MHLFECKHGSHGKASPLIHMKKAPSITGGAFAAYHVLPFSDRELLAEDLTGLADAIAFRRIDDIEGLRARRNTHMNILSGHREAFCGYI